jgi:hypothetical protein
VGVSDVTAHLPNYDGRRFAPAGSDTAHRPVASWRQDGSTVTARFSGGHVLAGFLLGTVAPDGVVDAAYGQLLADGTVHAGRCTTTPQVLPDGRLRMREEWHRTDGTSGVSHIEEVLP